MAMTYMYTTENLPLLHYEPGCFIIFLLKVSFMLIKTNRWSELCFLRELIGKYGMIYIIRE